MEDIRAFILEQKGSIDSFDFVCGSQETRAQLKMQTEAEVPGVRVTSSVSHLLEIGNAEAGKGKTLLALLEMLGISREEAAAFGDADNDLDMLQAVKYSVAMGNAPNI